MERHVQDYLLGYVRIRITGTSYDRFLNLCAFHRIRLWKLLPAGEAYEACISNRDFKSLRAIVKKSHVRLRIVGRYGLPFFIHRYRKRKIYVCGILASLCFMYWLSAHVWNISIDGNLSQTTDVLFEYLGQNGIYHGMRKKGLDCRQLAADIRNYFTDFSWVAVELAGTRLQIQVREGRFTKTEPEPALAMENGNAAAHPSSLAASEDGTLVSLYVRKGLAQAEPGDEVKRGQILVTGALPVCDDGGGILGYQYVAADADAVIRTQQAYRDEVALETRQKHYTGSEKTGCVLEVGGHPFAFGTSFETLGQYDVTGKEQQLRLMENFYLPVILKTYTARAYEYQKITGTRAEITGQLKRNLQFFLQKLAEKGVQIFENDVKIEWTETSAAATGTLTLGKPAVRRVAVSDSEEEEAKHEYG